MTETPWLLVLIAAVGAACFWAGWRSARAYLQAAQAVSELTNAIAEQSNSYGAALDKSTSEYALLRAAVNSNTEVVGDKLGRIEDSLVTLFTGFQRAGIVGSPGRSPGRQVGEKGPE